MADYKDKEIKKFEATPIAIGDAVEYTIDHVECSMEGRGKNRHEVRKIKKSHHDGIVKAIDGDILTIKPVKSYDNSHSYDEVTRTISEVTRTDIIRVGANPFVEKHWRGELETTAFPLGSICGLLGMNTRGYRSEKRLWEIDGVNIEEYNDDPFVIDKEGNKQYYQRGYVWTLEQQQDLIRSIFNGLDCGKIVVRHRAPEWVIKEIKSGNRSARLVDIVDGKQRLNAIKSYLNDEFEVDGIYFSDLSELAVRKFEMCSPITYCCFREKASDEDIIQAFLNVNYTGVQCSKEHLEYVMEINKKM